MPSDIEEVLKTFMRSELDEFMKDPLSHDMDKLIGMLDNFKEFKQHELEKSNV